MRAFIVDPQGPRWARMLVPIAACLMVALGAAVPGPWDTRLLVAGTALLAIAPLVSGHRRRREVGLELGAGFVDVLDADPGLLTQRIRGRRLRGASTSELDHGVGLVLQTPDRPIALELRERADAEAVLAALGVGHGGFGWIDLDAEPDRAAGVARALRRLALVPLVASVVGAVFDPPGWGVAVFITGFWTTVALLIVGVATLVDGLLSPRSRLRLEPGGISVQDGGLAPLAVPYDAMVHVATTPDRLVLGLHTGQQLSIKLLSSARALLGGLTHAQRAHVVAQIRSAAQRARGLGPLPRLVSDSVAGLGRGAESARAWLRRLDVTAASMRAESAYRAAPLTRDELWTALESSDAIAVERAAAARILAKLEGSGVRKRIERVASATRDPRTERRIRIVLEPDAEAAARKLDALEALEAEVAPPHLVARAPAA